VKGSVGVASVLGNHVPNVVGAFGHGRVECGKTGADLVKQLSSQHLVKRAFECQGGGGVGGVRSYEHVRPNTARGLKP
jgi:hypothetical protein